MAQDVGSPARSQPVAQDLGPSAPARSIRQWARCGENVDNTEIIRRAFRDSSRQHFSLIIDCPIYLDIGSDITRPIFMDSNVDVRMTGGGKFIVNDVMMPAFVMADVHNIYMEGWRIEYRAKVPVNPDLGGYYKAGRFIQKVGKFQPAFAFNDETLTNWLRDNRGVVFKRRAGQNDSPWQGPTNTSAIILMVGDVHDIQIRGLAFFVPKSAQVDQFIPVCISTNGSYRDNQAVADVVADRVPQLAVPHKLDVSHLYFDGVDMGWVGNLQDVKIAEVRSIRYADMQDASGTNLGGVGKWFAPPHLFYLSAGNGPIHNKNIQVTNVFDEGKRVGSARDLPGDKLSGYAVSLKIGADDSLVSNYVSHRPDGLMDVLGSNNLTFRNVKGIYNSEFTHALYPGLRFPGSGYQNIKFDGLDLQDLALVSNTHVIWAGNLGGQVQFSRSQVIVNQVGPEVDVVPKQFQQAGLKELLPRSN